MSEVLDKPIADAKIHYELKNFFGEQIPGVFSLLEAKGMLDSFWPLFRDSFLDPGINDEVVKQGIAISLAVQSRNKTCFLLHAFVLKRLGLSLEEIQTLALNLSFPSRVPESEKWSRVVQWTFLHGFTIGKIRDEAGQAGSTLLSLVTPDENRAVLRIIMAVEAMLQFTIHFPDEAVWEKDPFFRDSSEKLLFPVPDFVKYFTQNTDPSMKGLPVSTICMYCKSIQDKRGDWHALESALPNLSHETRFSHGICPVCYEKHINA
jgi:alkylhydroperoxidase/carboxymuconolactone decarboxylase family protein YurZ